VDGTMSTEEYWRLVKLAQDPDWYVRLAVARRPDLPPDLVEQLARDEDWEMRQAVTEREDLPPALATRLAGDGNW